jgi:hypothetical protein
MESIVTAQQSLLFDYQFKSQGRGTKAVPRHPRSVRTDSTQSRAVSEPTVGHNPVRRGCAVQPWPEPRPSEPLPGELLAGTVLVLFILCLFCRLRHPLNDGFPFSLFLTRVRSEESVLPCEVCECSESGQLQAFVIPSEVVRPRRLDAVTECTDVLRQNLLHPLVRLGRVSHVVYRHAVPYICVCVSPL